MFAVAWFGDLGSVRYDTYADADRAISEILEEAFGWDGDAAIWIAARDEYDIVAL